jgi:hypothetical protein
MDDRVPQDAIAYMGWAGADTLGPQYANSNLKGILDASIIQEFISKQLPKLIDQAAQQNPAAPAMFAKAQATMNIIWKHPTALYFCPIDYSNPQIPAVRFGIVCDAGTDAKTIAATITDDLAKAPPNPRMPVKLVQDGNVLIITFGKADTAEELKKGGGLAASPAYKAAMEKAKSPSAAIASYVDVTKIVATINEGLAKVPNTPPDLKEKVPATIEALGLNGVTQLAATAGFDGKGWTAHTWIGTSGPKKGLLALLDAGTLSEKALSFIPKDAAAFSAWKLDLHKAFTETRTVIGKVDAQAQRDFDAGIADGSKAVGFDIEKELIAPLGDEWVVYRAPLSDEGGNSFALVLPLRDGETLSKSLAKLETLFNAQAGNGGIPFKIEKITAARTEVSTIAFMNIFSVAWGVKNGNLYVSSLAGIGGAIKQVENKSPSIVESDLYKAARAALPADAKPVSLAYANPAKLYPEFRRTIIGYLPILRQAGVDVPMEILPDPDDVTKFMTPGASMMWMDADGLHGSSNSSFPGAEMLGGQQVGPTVVAGAAVGVAVSLPRAAQVRQTDAVSVDAANLRAIAQSAMVYAADHNDQMPADVARLVADGMVAPRQLVSRRSGTQPLQLTPELEKLAKDNFSKFSETVAEHCDYVYLGKDTKSDANAAIVVAYEKPSSHTPDGITVAFGDAHAEFVRWPNVSQAFEATNDKFKKEGKPAVDTKAMMQAAGLGLP